MQRPNKTDIYLYLILFVVVLIGVFVGRSNPELFIESYVPEDGIVEYVTAFLLLACSTLLFRRWFKLKSSKHSTWKIMMLLYAAMLIFGFGEEISWGQRIFGFETPAPLEEINTQDEFNFHNIKIFGVKINKLIFSQLFSLIMLFYFTAVPLLYRKKEAIRDLFNRFAIPIPKWHHAIAIIVGGILVSLIGPEKKWELFELTFGVVAFLIVLQPLNKHEIYS